MEHKQDRVTRKLVRGPDGKIRLGSSGPGSAMPDPMPFRPATPLKPKTARRSRPSFHMPHVRLRFRMPALPALKLPFRVNRKWFDPVIRFLRKAAARFKRLLPNRYARLAVLIGILAFIAAGGFMLAAQPEPPAVADQTTANNASAPPPDELPKGTPEFKTLTPKGAGADKLGGWSRISPPDRDPVYAYTDTLYKVPISVSQQPLPRTLRGTEAESSLSGLAKSFSANKELEVEDATAYVGSSVKGPQSLIASKKGLLILIKSSAAVPDDQWIAYLTSLK